jgi:hypothetical protein
MIQNIASLENRRLTLKQYLQVPHAMILAGNGHQAMVDRAFGSTRRKTAACSKNSVFYSRGLCYRADRSGSHGASYLGQDRGDKRGLRMIKPPWELKTFPYFMSWHPRLTNEAAHAWLSE